MATERVIAWVERLAWILVYGGLFSAVLGWVSRREDASTGILLMSTGGLAVVAGAVLIGVRARLRETDPNRATDTQGHP
jgi:hypothetical protein